MTRNEFIAETAAKVLASGDIVKFCVARSERLADALEAAKCAPWRDDPLSLGLRSQLSATEASMLAKIPAVVAQERERCAKVCERMVVGGRAWTHEQEIAAKVLTAAADFIRTGKDAP